MPDIDIWSLEELRAVGSTARHAPDLILAATDEAGVDLESRPRSLKPPRPAIQATSISAASEPFSCFNTQDDVSIRVSHSETRGRRRNRHARPGIAYAASKASTRQIGKNPFG